MKNINKEQELNTITIKDKLERLVKSLNLAKDSIEELEFKIVLLDAKTKRMYTTQKIILACVFILSAFLVRSFIN